MRAWLWPLATIPGFPKPGTTPVGLIPTTSFPRASSPRNEQGGKWPLLILGICLMRQSETWGTFTQESLGPTVVGLRARAKPFPGPDRPRFYLRGQLTSSARPCGSLAALGTSRWRSAHADNGACAGFPLDPLRLTPARDGTSGKRPAMNIQPQAKSPCSSSQPVTAGFQW